MKVLHIELGKRRFGGTMQVYYLLRELRKINDVECALVCPMDSPLHRLAAQEGVLVFPIRYRGDTDVTAVAKLWRIYRRFAPDIVHIHSRRGADVWGALTARLYRHTKVIISRRVDNPIKRSGLTRLLYGPLSDRIIAVSKGIVEVLVQGGVERAKIAQVYSAIVARDYQVTADAAALRAQWHIPSAAPVVAVIAQLIPRKGHRYLLLAAPEILAAHPATVFLFLGEGVARADLEAQATALGISHRVVFAGYRHDVGALLNIIDIVVHPATMEGFANVAMQAMAAAVPVVSSAVGGMPESVRHEINGLLVPPADPPALAAAINRLLADATLRHRLGEQGRRIVESEFTVEAMAAGNLAVYRALLSPHK